MGLGRERVSGEAVWADKQLEVSIWETKCREAMVQVYWDRVEAPVSRALDTLDPVDAEEEDFDTAPVDTRSVGTGQGGSDTASGAVP